MPNIRKKVFSDYAVQSWKNGGGTTYEILVAPQPIGFHYRLSLAAIEKSGPFSNFEGYMRILVPLAGELSLKHGANKPVDLEIFEPYKFDGAMPTIGVLTSVSARDFNVIYDPQHVSVEVEAICFHGSLPLEINGDQDYVFCQQGEVVVTALGKTRLSSNDLCEIQASGPDQRIDMAYDGTDEGKIIHVSIKKK